MSDKENPLLKAADRAWVKQREEAGELEKIIGVSDYGSDVLETLDQLGRLVGAAGPGRDGKWPENGGLVSKGGYRRVFRQERQFLDESDFRIVWLQRKIDQLDERKREMFTNCVINPLQGDGTYEAAIKDMAARYDIKTKRVYKILDWCSSGSRRNMKMNDTQIHNAIGRVVGSIYIALTQAMPKENAEIAHGLLFRWADNEELRPEDRRIYRLIALSASRSAEELQAENEEEEQQPQFEVITGGAA